MTEKQTIAQAVIQVLQKSKQPMTVPDITQAILDKDLFTFNSKDPKGIVRGAIERRSGAAMIRVKISHLPEPLTRRGVQGQGFNQP